MNLELRHLKVVCAIAETGSVTKAASQLGLAQPALTAQLQRIERTLGGPLFDRDRRGARPTALGELVLSRARVLLPAMKGLQDEAARLAGAAAEAEMTRYRFGSTGGPLLGGIVQRLSASRPETQITTQASYSIGELAGLVQAGKLDYAQGGVCGDSAPPAAEAGLVWQPIAVDAICVMMREDHPAAAGDDVALADLADAHWVGQAGDGCLADCFAAACAKAGFTPRRLLETDVRSGIDMVESGAAVGLCQPTFRAPAGLTHRPMRGSPLRWRLMIGWHPDSPAAQSAPTILRMAQEAYHEVMARNPRYLAWAADHHQLATAA